MDKVELSFNQRINQLNESLSNSIESFKRSVEMLKDIQVKLNKMMKNT